MTDTRVILLPRTMTPQELDFSDEEITKEYPRESIEETALWWTTIWGDE